MGKVRPVISRAIFHDFIPVRPVAELVLLNRPSARSMKFRGIREGLMQKRKPLASNVALVTALMLSGQNIAFAEKEGVGRNHAAIPNVNLGFTAVPNMRAPVGLPAAALAPKAGSGSTSFGGSGAGESVGNGSSAQTTAPGATRSAPSSGPTPLGEDHPRGERADRQYSSNSNDSRSSGSRGSGHGQGDGEEQDSGTSTSTGAPSGRATPTAKRLAAESSQSKNSSGKSPDQLPTCR